MKNIHKILLVAIVLRSAIALLYPLTGDSFLHLSAARYIADVGSYPSEDTLLYGSETSFFYPPLLHYLMAVLIKMLSLNYLTYSLLELLPIIAGVFSIYYAYLLLIELGIKNSDAEMGALVLTFLPVHVFYSAVLYIDIFPALFVPMAALYLIRGIREKRFMYLFVISCALASWSYILGLVAPLFAIGYIILKRDRIRKVLPYFILAIILSSPFYLMMTLRTGQLLWTGGTGGVELSNQRNIISTFYSLWIGSPNSGPGYERMMSYLPVLRIPMLFWSLIFAALTIAAIIKIPKIPRELQLLLLVSLPGLIIFPEFISKMLSAAPAIALMIYLALKSVPLKKEYVMLAYCVLLLHVIPFAYMLNQRWVPYTEVYSFVRSECDYILTGDVGRVSINTDSNATSFGRLGLDYSNIETGNYHLAIDEAKSEGIDCVFYDTYTLNDLLTQDQIEHTSGFLAYLDCPLMEIDGISFYFCKI
jgi:hypothetical protein